jgi:hypothetical protein
LIARQAPYHTAARCLPSSSLACFEGPLFLAAFLPLGPCVAQRRGPFTRPLHLHLSNIHRFPLSVNLKVSPAYTLSPACESSWLPHCHDCCKYRCPAIVRWIFPSLESATTSPTSRTVSSPPHVLTSHHAGSKELRSVWDTRDHLAAPAWYGNLSLHPGPRGMEIGGLLNSRHAADAQMQQMQHMQHSMHLGDQPFALSHASTQLGHHHQSQLHDHSGMHYQLNQNHAQTQNDIYNTNFEARQQNFKQEPQSNNDYLDRKVKGEEKPFPCTFLLPEKDGGGPCQKAFARKSDLARHRACSMNRDVCNDTDCSRPNTYGRKTTSLRMGRLWEVIHSTICPDSPHAYPHGR